MIGPALMIAAQVAAAPATPPTPVGQAAEGADRRTAMRVEDVSAEYVYLRRHKLRPAEQSLVVDDPAHAFDLIRAVDARGTEREVWFDISRFCGKGFGL